MVFKTAIISNNTDAISAETLARTTADGLQNTATNNTDAITAEALARTTADSKTQLLNNTDAISAETLIEQQQMVFKTQLFLIRMQ
jgi:hypothetical protein